MTVATPIRVGDVMVNLINGDRIVDSLNKPGRGAFEPQTLQMWAELCAAGGVVLDVGAYTGLFAIAARKLGCDVHAFEPMTANAGRFRENCKFNGVAADLAEVAVTDHLGQVTLHYNPIPFTAGASLLRKTGTPLTVEGVTIDSLRLPAVKAIKIDVERAEPLVLAGARETLARCKPVLIVETLDAGLEAATLAAAPGYRVAAQLDGRNRMLVPC